MPWRQTAGQCQAVGTISKSSQGGTLAQGGCEGGADEGSDGFYQQRPGLPQGGKGHERGVQAAPNTRPRAILESSWDVGGCDQEAVQAGQVPECWLRPLSSENKTAGRKHSLPPAKCSEGVDPPSL